MNKSVSTLTSVFARPMKKVLAVISGMILVLASFNAAQAASYTYTTLDYPGATDTEAWGINNDSTIVGKWYDDDYDEVDGHGFVLSGATWTPLDYPNAIMWTHAFGIDNSGKIVGAYVNGAGDPNGFLLDGTSYEWLVCPSSVYTYPHGINDAGTIVGWAWVTGPTSFVLNGTTWTLLDYSPAWVFEAHGINNDGTIVGTYWADVDGINHGRSLSGTTWTTLDYPGAEGTEVYGINNNSTIVGGYQDSIGNTHGFSFDGTTWTTLDYPEATSTVAHGINDKGMIVGMYEDATGTHGFLATPPPILTVVLEGSGSGLVLSNPSGISCEPDCSEGFTAGTVVTITATLYPGSAFAHWSGGCSGTINTCVLTVTQDITVTAHFVTDETKEYNLKVTRIKVHKGDGLVTNNDGNIDCGDTCKYKYYKETEVTLTASPFQGSVFKGWKPLSLNCTGTGPCTVSVGKSTEVKAVFVGDYKLKVINKSKEGGSGTVTSTPSGITCSTGDPAGCEDFFAYNEEVTLSASADTGSTFIGWRPASKCPGTGDCTVTMNKKRTIKAVHQTINGKVINRNQIKGVE